MNPRYHARSLCSESQSAEGTSGIVAAVKQTVQGRFQRSSRVSRSLAISSMLWYPRYEGLQAVPAIVSKGGQQGSTLLPHVSSLIVIY